MSLKNMKIQKLKEIIGPHQNDFGYVCTKVKKYLGKDEKIMNILSFVLIFFHASSSFLS